MRDIRYRFIGILAFIVFFLSLLLSNYSLEPTPPTITLSSNLTQQTTPIVDFSSNLTQQSTPTVDLLKDPVTFAILGLILTILVSEGIGYFFSSIAIFLWNGCFRLKGYTGGYSGVLKQGLGDDENIIQSLDNDVEQKIFKGYRDLDYDLFISYFWQRADKSLLDWAVRRWNIYFTNLSAIVTIIMTYFISMVLINKNFFDLLKSMRFEISFNNYLLGLGLFLYCLVLCLEARRNKVQAINMIKLWLQDPKNLLIIKRRLSTQITDSPRMEKS
jgi:hypothetical protein